MRKIRTAFFAVVSLAVIILNLSAIFGDFGPKVLYADVKPPGYRYKITFCTPQPGCRYAARCGFPGDECTILNCTSFECDRY
jgi:hypothetical protein